MGFATPNCIPQNNPDDALINLSYTTGQTNFAKMLYFAVHFQRSTSIWHHPVVENPPHLCLKTTRTQRLTETMPSVDRTRVLCVGYSVYGLHTDGVHYSETRGQNVSQMPSTPKCPGSTHMIAISQSSTKIPHNTEHENFQCSTTRDGKIHGAKQLMETAPTCCLDMGGVWRNTLMAVTLGMTLKAERSSMAT